MSATEISPETQTRWDADIELPAPRQNRDVTFMHKVEAGVAKALLRLMGAQRIDKAAARMGGFMKWFGPMLRPVHARGHANLQLVYPDMTAAERAAILRGVWENIGATTAEFAHMAELADRTRIINEDRLQEVINSGGKAIFFSGHFANWEAMGATLHRAGLRYALVYRAANNPLVDAEIIRLRGAAMSRWQIPKNQRASRDLIKSLKENLSLCMLTDQKLNDGISSPLLGYDAMTATASAKLALREQIPLIPIQLVREPGSRFVMTVHEPLDPPESPDDQEAAIQELTDRMNEKIGEFILDRPDQWLWFHRRWPRDLVG